jgi:four helix bundle protein
MLDYERLDVYQRAIEHLAFVFRSFPSLPRGYSALVDQWRRAAMSVPLNVAEAGRENERRRSKQPVRDRTAMESGAIIDVIRMVGTVPESELAAAKQLLVRVVGMLSKLCR